MNDPGSATRSALQAIPSVDRLLASGSFQSLGANWRRDVLRRYLQMRLDQYRLDLREGRQAPLTRETILKQLAREWAKDWDLLARQGTRRVINASGVLLHTNLGRAALSPRARAAVAQAARWPVDLELDLDTGRRASRLRKLEPLLRALTGVEAAFAVNNNSAALTLAVDTLARKRRLIVSRGEQVEIGGSFRLPEILERFAGSMVEVGTTNRTRLSDYAQAIRKRGDVLLKVHRSNFEQIGYVEEVSLPDLVALGRERQCPVVYDLGSGRFDAGMAWLKEPAFEAALAADPDLITFSGDKVFGGPQAGLILGRFEIVEAMKRNPLARALRLDKLNLAALLETLAARAALSAPLPTRDILSRSRRDIEAMARELKVRLEAVRLPGLRLEIRKSQARSGGGAAAESAWPSAALTIGLPGLGAGRLAARLREARPAVLGLVRQEEFLLDLAAVDRDELTELTRVLTRVLKKVESRP